MLVMSERSIHLEVDRLRDVGDIRVLAPADNSAHPVSPKCLKHNDNELELCGCGMSTKTESSETACAASCTISNYL